MYMPRLFRKISHQEGAKMNRSIMSDVKSNETMSSRPAYQQKIERYDNTTSTLGKGEKYTLVQHPLRTKMSTISKGSQGVSKTSDVKP